MAEVKTDQLKDYEGNKFAPKTASSSLFLFLDKTKHKT